MATYCQSMKAGTRVEGYRGGTYTIWRDIERVCTRLGGVWRARTLPDGDILPVDEGRHAGALVRAGEHEHVGRLHVAVQEGVRRRADLRTIWRGIEGVCTRFGGV
eukprot:4924364-Pyramimonas_sp.AAC.1